MDCPDYTTAAPRRKRQHLREDNRGAIEALHREGRSNRYIARQLGCSPTTVGNELKRGAAPNGGYSAQRGQASYHRHRRTCHRRRKTGECAEFIAWVIGQFRQHKWSLDACCGYAREHRLFAEIPCARTFYSMVWRGEVELKPTELPEVLRRKRKRHRLRERKRVYGASIAERPPIAALRLEEGHWEVDSVVGQKRGKRPAILTLHEKRTRLHLAIRIAGKTSAAVMAAMRGLREEYGDRFPAVFKTLTADNGSEFADLAQVESWGSEVYFAHPYSSWERAQNERGNGLLRRFVPKGADIGRLTAEQVLQFADDLNGRPRRQLGYRTPEELFDDFLDRVYAA